MTAAEPSLEGIDEDTRQRVQQTFAALQPRGIAAIYVPNREAALKTMLQMIPNGSRVAHGSSTTLEEIGFVARMKGPSPSLLERRVVCRGRPAKRARLRI